MWKYFIALLLIVIIANSQSALGENTWETKVIESSALNYIGIYGFKDLCFTDENNGWAITYHEIFNTKDGGKSWKIQSESREELWMLQFVDHNTGWVVGFNGTILHTRDGGSKWSVQKSNTDELIYRVCFIDTQTGWVLGKNNIFLHTDDGGNTWKQLDTKVFDSIVYEAFFLDENEGWMLTYKWKPSEMESIEFLFHTDNGGVTWNCLKQGFDVFLNSIFFISSMEGWAVEVKGHILHTTDSGLTWEVLWDGTLENWTLKPEISFINSELGIVVEDDYRFNKKFERDMATSIMLITRDGGKNWDVHETIFGVWSSISFVNEEEIWVGGYPLHHSLDGGRTWKTLQSWQPMGTTCFVNEKGWLVGGYYGKIIHTPDGGKTWDDQESGKEDIDDSGGITTLRSISFVDEKEGWIVGSGGTVLHTIDGGVTWEKQTIDPEAIYFYHVTFVNPMDGFVAGCGSSHKIFYTHDGGKTWGSATIGKGDISWDYLDFVDSQHGWAVSYWDGQVARTDDGGRTWTVINKSAKTLRRVYFVNEQEGWGIGNNNKDGFIYHTTDGGKSWKEVRRVTIPLLDLYFISPMEGWAIGGTYSKNGALFFDPGDEEWEHDDPGIILHTINRGMSWVEQYRSIDTELYSISYNGNSSLYVFGYNSADNRYIILKYTDTSLHKGQAFDPSNKLVTTWGKVKDQLFQNYPNPFNPGTWIPYQLAEDSEATINIYNSEGKLIRTLDLGSRKAGSYQAHWNGKDEKGQTVASGIYFYVLKAGEFSGIKKMALVR